jgi:eukaryotic-like serine/threonine-protein kinase
MEERFGPWRLGRTLASGGLAEVSIARRDGEDREIALKRLHPHQARDTEVASLFLAEAALTRDIEPHPHLVRGLDAGDEGGRPWLALDLVDGGDVRRLLDAGARPPMSIAIAWLADAAAATAHLHERGWLHGDINPSNLLVGRDGRVRLCDLGVARLIGEGGPVRGTHAYMAPEQVRGERWTAAVDVFALGVILWELVSGSRLFHRGPSYLTMAAVIAAEVPALPDAALDALARRALHADPAQRIPLGELQAGLAALRP